MGEERRYENMDTPGIPNDSARDTTRRENTVSFILAITKTYSSSDIVLHVATENKGVPNAEVILILEAWLKQMKDQFNASVGKAMHFEGEFGL